MEDARWLDPLLLTSDISWRKQSRSSSHYASSPSPSSKEASTMADHGNENGSVEANDTPKICKSVSNNILDTCPSSPEFSFSPDVVVCGGSPDIYTYGNEDLHDVLKNTHQKGMTFSDETPATTCLSSVWEGSEKNALLEASFDLSPKQELGENSEILSPVVCINAGSTEQAVDSNGTGFLGDDCFAGGDIITTDVKIGDVECFPLYQTARFGNFSYHFPSLEPGNYLVDLHLSEIVFTDGPPGLRVFDVYIQEKKVVCGLDIFARVGANRPLLISNLKGFIDDNEGLSIKFEGVSGSPIVCGISVRKDYLAGFREDESVEFKAFPHVPDCDSLDVIKDCEVDGESEELRRDYECQKKELTEANQALKELRRDNELKSRECQEALNSLRELQNELMRKSMHVGSLAFAVEGQVKEKSKWFSSLRDLKRKLKNMKSDQAMLSAEALAYKNMVLQMDDMSSTIQSKMIQLVDQNKDLKFKFNEGAKERKELYNKVLEIKGNIRVFCRCRPLNTEEIAGGASMAIDFESAKDGELAVKSNGAVKKTFKFDSVFNPQADQVDVFKDTAPFATSVLDGYNVCIFAYGQTGTGKTFTMVGTDEARGVNFRTLVELFRIIKEREKIFRYDVSVSVLEVYNEQIRDLLVTGMQPGVAAKRLEIRQTGEGIHHVPGLVEANVNNMAEVWEVLKSGSNARAVGATNANEHSSRSHCIHSVIVKGENLLNGECTKSKLWLVDLAGSERVAKTEVQGERLKETQNINRSLSALGDVISALVTKSPHIPFRNSKLTHLLQDSLGGDSKTLMFVQISPNENDLSETLCSLNFASRVRGIELGPAKKQLDNGELLKYKQMFEKIKQENKSKDLQIRKMEETIHGLDMKVKERDLKNKSLQDKVKELETHLQMERTNAAATRPPLPNRVLGTQKNVIEPANTTIGKDTNFTLPLTENTNCCKMPALPATDCFVKYVDPKEKENNLEIGHHPPPLPKRTGRASICTTARRMVSDGPASRRNSLMPSPKYAPSSFPTSSPLPPLPTLRDDDDDDEKENTDGPEALCLPEQTLDSPADLRSGTKKLNSILRRSIQKKMHSKSPAQHYLRGGINVGMEKVRVSIGSRGRLGHRVLLGSARRVVGGKEVVTGQQKQIERVKERGWNVGAAGKTVL